MRLITRIEDMQDFSRRERAAGKSLGLVPTMGALHDGHFSLVRRAQLMSDVVVVSIFVNPTQFAPSEDYARYPQNVEKDLELLAPYRVRAVFAPSAEAMYPQGFETYVHPGEMAAQLEGSFRPGHFRGVATVVLKLFNIVRPDVAYFGQKDLQQALVIRRLVEDLNLGVRLVICPIARDPDGLARSSRNEYLSAEDRKAALTLSRSLKRAEELAHAGETEAVNLLAEMRKVLAAEPRVACDYVAIVEPSRLRPVDRISSGCVALVAARVGSTRLIDNLIFGPRGASSEMLLQLALTASPVVDTQARVPGLETEILKQKVEGCRDCAAVSSILLPPREFLAKYLKRDYADLNAVRVAVIGRDAPISPENFLYRSPDNINRFVSGLYELLGVKDFSEFRQRFVLTDAVRCHASGPRVPDKALEHCAKHLREELKLFPHLETIVVLGDDACRQFQRLILGRDAQPFDELVREYGCAEEKVRIPSLDDRPVRVFYCYHPTYGYKRSPSIAQMLSSLS